MGAIEVKLTNRPKVFIKKIMPVNLLNEQVYYESDRLLDPHHIFQEKVGIFIDSQGDRVVFSGSNNESLSGWESNIESFHVYCSWQRRRN
jgi:hypothetical protein